MAQYELTDEEVGNLKQAVYCLVEQTVRRDPRILPISNILIMKLSRPVVKESPKASLKSENKVKDNADKDT